MSETLLIAGVNSDLSCEYLKTLTNKKIIALYHTSHERLKVIAGERALDIEFVRVDFNRPESIADLMGDILTRHKITQVLSLAAPQIQPERFNNTTLLTYQEHYNVQFLSVVELLKPIIKQMKKQQNGKIILLLSSYTQGMPPKFLSPYVTMKYALLGLIKSLAGEYAAYNIQINGISPSMMLTKFIDTLDERTIKLLTDSHPMKRNITLQEVIGAIDYLFSVSGNFITGQNLVLSGGETV